MKPIFAHKALILFLSLGLMLTTAPTTIAEAATPQKTQQQKKAAQAKKAREKEKAKKQKAAEKQKADRQKQQQKAQKQQADKQKAQAKQKSATAASKPKATPLTAEQAEQAYQKRVSDAERYNARVAAYSTRDISHRIGLWGQAGYSAIFDRGIAYDASTSLGFDTKTIGGFGGGAGLGYQLRYKQFLFTTGLEYEQYNSLARLSQAGADITRTFSMQPYSATMSYKYAFSNSKDQWRAGYLQLPLLFGMEMKSVPIFWQAGPKVGLNIIGSSDFSTDMSTSGIDKELIDPLQQMNDHLFVDRTIEQTNSLRFSLNVAAAAEVGIMLDQWLQPKIRDKRNISPSQQFALNLRYRLSLFAEYGVLNVQKQQNIHPVPAGALADLPVQLLTDPANPIGNLPTYSALETTTAANARLNPFLVGVKLAVFYELPRKKMKMVAIPKAPTPRMAIEISNQENGQMLGGAMVNIRSTKSGSQSSKTSNSTGIVIGRYTKGEYAISAQKPGFYASDTVLYQHTGDLRDTLRFALTPLPEPVLPTLCAFVVDEETNSPLEAQVSIAAAKDAEKILYEGETADDGLLVTALTAGEYNVSLTKVGYMPTTATITFEADTLSLRMQRIKQGIKVKIENLFFATARTNILPESEESLNNLATFLLDNTDVTIRIIGHTDAIGSESSNQILSEGRAAAVRNELVKRGVDPSRIETEGRGENDPIADNDTEEGRALNRRVEFEITSTGGKDIQQVK